MNILCFTPLVDAKDDARGFIHEWMYVLSERVDQLRIITLNTGSLELPHNVIVHSLYHRRTRKIFTLLRFYRALVQCTRERKPDVIFVHMIPLFAILASPLARLRGIPIVMWYTHGNVSWKLRIAVRCSDLVATASAEGLRIDTPKKRVMGHGINIGRFRPRAKPDAQRNSLIYVGRISPSKDVITLLRAIARIRFGLPSGFCAHIIGAPFGSSQEDVRYQHELARFVADNGLEEVVKFPGPVPHFRVSDIYKNATVCVNPSRTGSLDKSGLEAMASGVPLVTCNLSYVPLLAGYESLLFFPEGDVDALSERLTRIFSMTPMELDDIGAVLGQRVEREHGLNDLMTKMINIFKEAINIRS